MSSETKRSDEFGDPLKVGRCMRPKRLRHPKLGLTLRRCGQCWGCSLERHENLVGRCIGEALSSAACISLTLTYADVFDENGNSKKPDGARRVDLRHVAALKDKLRHNGFKVRSVTAPEFGSENGRAHFHLLLFFEWSEMGKVEWLDKFAEVGCGFEAMHSVREDWSEALPLFVSQDGFFEKRDFGRLCSDPSILFLQLRERMRAKGAKPVRQKWEYWPHGSVQAELVCSPVVQNLRNIQTAIRYVIKYLEKDPWKDNPKLSQRPFSELPEHVKQTTAYSWCDVDKRFVKHNPYRRELEAAYAAKWGKSKKVPVEEQLFVAQVSYRPQGGLGRVFFEGLGRYSARRSASDLRNPEMLLRRQYFIKGVHKKKPKKSIRSEALQGRLKTFEGERNFKFYMTETSFIKYGLAYNQELASMGLGPVEGINGGWELQSAIDRRNDRRDYASGPFGYKKWKESFSVSERKRWETVWGKIPNSDLKGLVPKRWVLWFEENSKLESWKKKRLERLEARKYGKIVYERGLPKLGDRIFRTETGKLYFERDLKTGEKWWTRELLTVENLDHALVGALLPEGARAMRIEREGKGNQTLLAAMSWPVIRDKIARKKKASQ